MSIKVKLLLLWNELCRDTQGAFSLMWAVSMSAILLTIGASYDLSQISKAQALAQYSADNMALTASIAVDRGNKDRYVGNKKYSYEKLGAGAKDFTRSMKGSVQYDIVDDSDPANAKLKPSDKSKLLARATVAGTYKTAFMGIIPRFKTIKFTATSDVAYAAREGTPASIFFIVDNSGSMGDYDNSHVEKLSSLKSSMKNFMTTMDAMNSGGGDDILRTALYPYSQDYQRRYRNIDDDGVIPARVVRPKWGTLNNGQITSMRTERGTDSSGALEDAANAFPYENAFHDGENGNDKPLKFAVFMTDGANNTSYECATDKVWVDGHREYWVDTYRGWNKVYYRYERWFDRWVKHYPATRGGYEDKQVCTTDYWFDKRSIASCDKMKADGVKIYAIAYDVDRNQKAHAEAFMKQCSSGAEYFKSATDASALERAFKDIGESIATEVVRIKR